MAIQKINKLFPDDSHLMKTNTRLTFAFRVIARKLLYPAHEVKTQDAYATVREAYGVDKNGADILALLLARPHWRCPSDEPLEALGLSQAVLQASLASLVDRKLVIHDFNWEVIDSAHSLDKAFIRSVQEDLPLREAQARVLQDLFDLAVDNPLGEKRKKAVPKRDTNQFTPLWMQAGSTPPVTRDPAELDDEEDMGSFFLSTATDPEGTPIKELDTALERYAGQPFGEKISRFTGSLTHPQKMVFFYMLRQFKEQFVRTLHPSELTGPMAHLFSEHVGTLMEKGLVCTSYVWNRENNTSDTEHYRITPEAATLFKSREELIDKRAVSSIGSFISPETIERKELFFSPEDSRDLDRILHAALPKEYDRIIAALKAKRLRPCLSVLMYGPPGTGKTELSLQIALQTGRALLKADASKLNGIYIGEGEINFRNLFQTYRYICAVSDLAPILFVDEGDSLLSKRITEVVRAADKDANSVQNVILEELNSLPGLVIVTTNLVGNMDEAMFRRFMIKAQFHLPDVETRAAIWRSKLPALTEQEAAVLASQFPFSGGLIDNVVSVATTDEILYEKTVSLNDLLSYCAAEVVGQQTERRKIGF